MLYYYKYTVKYTNTNNYSTYDKLKLKLKTKLSYRIAFNYFGVELMVHIGGCVRTSR